MKYSIFCTSIIIVAVVFTTIVINKYVSYILIINMFETKSYLKKRIAEQGFWAKFCRWDSLVQWVMTFCNKFIKNRVIISSQKGATVIFLCTPYLQIWTIWNEIITLITIAPGMCQLSQNTEWRQTVCRTSGKVGTREKGNSSCLIIVHNLVLFIQRSTFCDRLCSPVLLCVLDGLLYVWREDLIAIEVIIFFKY